MPAEDAATEVWTYGGKRVADGRLRDLWLPPDGKRLLYKMPASVIGGLYEMKVERTGDSTFIYGKPTYCGERMDDHTAMTKLIVDDMSERTKHAALRREKNEDDPLENALLPLIRYAQACKTSQQRRTLIAAVLETIERNAW